MKLFTKLALVSSLAISANTMAMQQMDDAALSATTGQDGISIGIGLTEIGIDRVSVYDGDGLAVADNGLGGTAGAGAININNVKLTSSAALASGNFADITIDTDGGAGKAFLNIGAAIAGLDIELGEINVSAATKDDTTGFYSVGDGDKAVILNGLSLSTGQMTANVQLGNTPQGAMIKLNGSMVGGLEINNLSLHDASVAGGGDIVLGKIKINDTGSANMDMNVDVAVTTKGLEVTALKNKTDIYVQSIQLGSKDAKSIGDVQISGLKMMNGTNAGAKITITGH